MSCEEIRGELIAHHRGELSVLAGTRVDQHLLNCASCRQVDRDLVLGFDFARGQTETDRAHLLTLMARLEPYLEARPERRLGAGMGIGAAALAAGLALWALTIRPTEPELAPPPVVAKVTVPKVELEEKKPEPSLARIQPNRQLRVVAGPGWDGQVVEGEQGRTEVSMEHGFAVFDFTGGEGRTLALRAAEVEVEAQTTRFFVDTTRAGLTTIGVLAGRAEVRLKDGVTTVKAGERRTFGDGALVAPVEPQIPPDLYGDRFLDPAVPVVPTVPVGPIAIAPKAKAEPRPRRVEEVAPEPEPSKVEEAPLDLGVALAAAERKAGAGDRQGALDLYERLLDEPRFERSHALVRYEMALLFSESGATRDKARVLWYRLSSAGGEIGAQSALALCALDREDAPCRAAECLRQLSASIDYSTEVRAEAARLRARWGLEQIARCPQ